MKSWLQRWRPRIGFGAWLMAAAAVYAQSTPPPCPEPPAPGKSPVYVEGAVKEPGALTGRVLFQGHYTPMKWAVVKDRKYCGDSVLDESLVASADGKLRYAVISLDDIAQGKPLPREVKEVANKECRYQPHVEAASICSKLMITNHDAMLHNTHGYVGQDRFEPQKPGLTPDGRWVIAYEENGPPPPLSGPLVAFTTLFNLGLPTPDFKPKKTLREAGLVTLKCDAGHTWMTGYVWVKPHPYVTVTDADGRFTITDIPAGKHLVTCWHERLGKQEQTVLINPGTTATLDFTFTQK